MPFVIEESGLPDIIPQGVDYLNVLCDLYPASSSAVRRELAARLTVDGTVIPIKSFQYTEGQQDVAGTLRVELARLSDRSAITRDASFKFELGESGVYTTILDTARLSSSDYALVNNDITPADSFTLVATPLLLARLETSPLGTVVLHDPDRVAVQESDFISIPDIDGVEELVTIVPFDDLSLYDALQYVAEICGFSAFQTNIPDFPLRRVDFGPGVPYWSAVVGIVGIFEPILDFDLTTDTLIIRDGTADFQPDSDAARVFTASNIISAGRSQEIQRYKGTLLTYQEDGLGYDYWEFDIVHVNRWRNNVVGDYPLTRSEVWQQKFYRNAFPDTPVRTLRRIQFNYVDMAFYNIASSGERLNYNGYGLTTDRIKRVYARAKSPAAWTAYQALVPGVEIPQFGSTEEDYSSAADDTWATAFVLTRTEREYYNYLAHPYEPDSVYIQHHEQESRGLITRDSTDQQLETNFDQDLVTAQRSGNLKEGLGSYWGTTSFSSEQQTPLPNRQVLLRTNRTDQLNVDDGEALLPEDYEDVRVGDIGISVIKAITKQMYVYDGADSSATSILHLNGGEAPLTVLVPLVNRLNRRQDYPANVELPIPGFDLSLVKGRSIDPQVDGRAATTFGIFRVTGRTISGAEGKFTMSVTARQIGE
jgi:hypothetical protein